MYATISACIVLYRQDIKVLKKTLCLFRRAAISAHSEFDVKFKLFLVDNSKDIVFYDAVNSMLKSIDISPVTYVIIRNNINSGYSGGNNAVLEELDSDYHIVMNPDVYVYDDSFLEAIKYMQKRKTVGLLSPAIYGTDQVQVYLCKKNPTLFDMYLRSYAPKFIKNKFKKRMDTFEMRDCNYDKEILNVPFPSGCFMFFRTRIFQRLNGFDQHFFLYMEDADIGRRTLQITQSAYVPSVKVTHLWTRGTHNNFRLKLETIKSVLIYWKKWGGIY